METASGAGADPRLHSRYISTRDISREGCNVEAETWLVDGPKVIDVEGVRRLKVALLGGQVDIVGHDEPGARVEVHSVRGRDLMVRFSDGVLEVDHPQVRWDDWLDTFRSFTTTASA